MNESRKASLLSVTYNEIDNIVDFFGSISTQSQLPTEIIIVDGGSSDGTIEKIKSLVNNFPVPIKLYIKPKLNRNYCTGPIAKARNFGMSQANYEHVIITDAGTTHHHKWFETLYSALIKSESGFVGGRNEVQKRTEFQKLYSDIFFAENSNLTKISPSSRNLGITRENWLKVGGYPENSYTAEDTVFNMRLRENKILFEYCNDAVVYWSCPTSLEDAIEKQRSYAKGDAMQKILLLSNLKMALNVLVPLKIYLTSQSYLHARIKHRILAENVFSYFNWRIFR